MGREGWVSDYYLWHENFYKEKHYDKAIAFLRRVVRVYVETNGYNQAIIPYLEKIAVILDEQGEAQVSEMVGGFIEDIRLGASTTR